MIAIGFSGLSLVAMLAGALVFAGEPSAKGFDKVLNFGKVSFRVQSLNNSSLNKVTITSKGISDSKPLVVEADGTVVDAQIDDLDGNGYPEVYISVMSAGSGSYGSLIAYASNRNKSISPIYLSELTKKQLKGYMVHDTFAPVEGSFVRQFPLYQKSDTNANPTGKTRQIQYRLKSGEAGWKLVAYKTLEY